MAEEILEPEIITQENLDQLASAYHIRIAGTNQEYLRNGTDTPYVLSPLPDLIP